MSYSIGQIAALAGVSVRTLRHYDEIGLLSPADRTLGGYRRYHDRDAERLQQVMFYRELGFALDEIAVMLDDPDVDPRDHLRRQHALLLERGKRVRDMITAVERALEADTMGISLTPEERFEVFGDDDPAQYADEVRERWGDTDAYKQSMNRTKGYTKEDWQAINAEANQITEDFAAAMRDGEPADGVRAMDVAERHRRHIHDRFYDVTHDFHQCLGGMYVADERFKVNYDRVVDGLAQYIHDAIVANAARHAA
jgi:MerR family transcriptional regulator, thiopeptide resistance regulator